MQRRGSCRSAGARRRRRRLRTSETVGLPPPRIDGGMPLIVGARGCGARRATIADRPLPPQILSDLLWAAFGVNRPSGDRTAPYWRHVMVIDLYVAMADGVWLYDPTAHACCRI